MLEILRLVIRTLMLILITLVGLRIFTLLLQRMPGVIVGLSVIAIISFSYALYKGSFNAIGLHTKKSVVIALIVSTVLFIVSTAILIFTG